MIWSIRIAKIKLGMSSPTFLYPYERGIWLVNQCDDCKDDLDDIQKHLNNRKFVFIFIHIYIKNLFIIPIELVYI